MANAARVHILEKGLDPRLFSMLAFGGAGPVHAFQVARLMHAPQLIIPGGAGVLSALGFLVSPVASEELTSHVCRLDRMDWDMVNRYLESMENRATLFVTGTGVAAEDVKVTRVAEMRYCGQGHEITVEIPSGRLGVESIPAIRENFNSEYLLRYGRVIDGMPMETVTWRVVVAGPSPQLVPEQAVVGNHDKALKGSRLVYLGTRYEEVPVYDRYLIPEGTVIPGPCIIEEYESTTVVGHDSSVRVDAFRNIIIDLHQT
jgi:N-methylhydantoinase A